MLPDADYDNDAAGSSGAVSYAAPNLTWTGDLAVGATATVTYSVTVKNPDPGDKQMTNTVGSTALGNNCPAGGTDPACTAHVTVLVPQLTIAKTADAAEVVAGGTVNYTITVTNTGQTPYTGATLTDPLTGVLDDATYGNDASATSGAVSYAAPNLTWTGDLVVGAAATITYSVTTLPSGGGDHSLLNTVVSPTTGAQLSRRRSRRALRDGRGGHRREPRAHGPHAVLHSRREPEHHDVPGRRRDDDRRHEQSRRLQRHGEVDHAPAELAGDGRRHSDQRPSRT